MVYALIMLISLMLISRSMMLVVLLLEITGFIVMFFVSEMFFQVVHRDYFVLIFFSILVMEGVIALSGLIGLVSSSGGDYVSIRSVLK